MLRRLGIAFIVAAVALGAIVGALAARAATPSHVDPISGLPATGTTIVGDLDLYDANAPPSQTDWAVIGAVLLGLAAAGGVMIGSRCGNSDVRRLRIGFIVGAVVLGLGAGVVAARSGTRTLVARPHWPSAPTATSGNVGPNPGSTGDFITLQVAGYRVSMVSTGPSAITSGVIGGAMLGLVAIGGVAVGGRRSDDGR